MTVARTAVWIMVKDISFVSTKAAINTVSVKDDPSALCTGLATAGTSSVH